MKSKALCSQLETHACMREKGEGGRVRGEPQGGWGGRRWEGGGGGGREKVSRQEMGWGGAAYGHQRGEIPHV